MLDRSSNRTEPLHWKYQMSTLWTANVLEAIIRYYGFLGETQCARFDFRDRCTAIPLTRYRSLTSNTREPSDPSSIQRD